MSNFKEGEGIAIIVPGPFSNHHLKVGKRYQVVVLAGTEVVETSWVNVILPGTVVLHGEMGIYVYPNNWFRLHSRSKLFYTHYSEFYDVLIKDVDGRTVAALTNVEVIRE